MSSPIPSGRQRRMQVKVMPAELKSLLERQQTTEAQVKTELVASLKAAQTAYSEAELSVMTIEQLQRLATVAKIPSQPDYSGRGFPHFAAAEQSGDVFSKPPDGYALALQGKTATN